MDLIYFSPVPWNSIAQRPHFFVKKAIENGFKKVVWVNPTPSRFPERSDIRRLLSPFEADSFDKPENIDIISPSLIPIEPFNYIYNKVNKVRMASVLKDIKSCLSSEICHVVIGKPSLLSIYLLENMDFSTSSLDIMDDFPCFFNGIAKKSVSCILSRTIKIVDICIYSCSTLKDKYSLANDKSIFILNACDDLFLEKCNDIKYKKRKLNKRVFGYIGTVATWFDWDLVYKLANDYPSDMINIIGPLYSKIPLPKPNNINIFPAVEHSEIVEIIATFDFGLIPFKINELTESVDPVKYYEYKAMGIPVISSSFGQMTSRIKDGFVYDFSDFKELSDVRNEETSTWSQRFSPFFDRIL
ncbi:glycosyltransferase [Vibrio rumoiensis]|uniref:glycosyltransferase n=1 Tax=Vibrio rumoiensis TaxID=76258 RepID=UPI003AA96CBD